MSGAMVTDMAPPAVAARGQGFEDRPQAADDLRLSSDHQTVSLRPPPDAAAGPHVHKPQPALFQHRDPAQGVAIVGVAAVDDGVAAAQERHQGLEGLIDSGARWNHQPDDPGAAEPATPVASSRARTATLPTGH